MRSEVGEDDPLVAISRSYLALNQVDVAERHGIKVDARHLAQHLGCPVVPMVASRGEGLAELRTAVAEVASERRLPAAHVAYGEAETSVRRLQVCLIVADDDAGVDSRWLAIKLLERDPCARELTGGMFDAIPVSQMSSGCLRGRPSPCASGTETTAATGHHRGRIARSGIGAAMRPIAAPYPTSRTTVRIPDNAARA